MLIALDEKVTPYRPRYIPIAPFWNGLYRIHEICKILWDMVLSDTTSLLFTILCFSYMLLLCSLLDFNYSLRFVYYSFTFIPWLYWSMGGPFRGSPYGSRPLGGNYNISWSLGSRNRPPQDPHNLNLFSA